MDAGHATVDLFPLSAVEQSLVSRFAEIAGAFGERVALITPQRSWTYAELDAWSNAIAHAIIHRLGNGSEPVALLFDQGAENVATTLAILKTGKFYVPLEPSHPRSRSQGLFNFSGARLLVTNAAHAELAEGITADPASVLMIDGMSTAMEDPLRGITIDPNDPAYIFFTSGSTGKPKGVVDSHRNVLHNIRRYTNALRIGTDDRLTMIQSPTFSGTVSSLFSALLNGASLLPFDLQNEGFARLADWLVKSQATIYHSVPSIFRGVVESGEHFPGVRVVRLEGDGARSKDLEVLRSAFADQCLLAHGLGATETGLSCQYRMGADAVVTGDRLPIGQAQLEMDVRIVDDAGSPLPNGTVGEIEVRSEFLATGYWRDEQQTRDRFAQVNGRIRAYRTGDLGVMDPAGLLTHLGRKDLEHKINGNWVDTTEVGSALRAIGAFADAIVVTRKDGDRDARLVAYVVQGPGASYDPIAWRKALRSVLPDHMVPNHFVRMERLPLTDHGKVDRRALPEPDITHTQHATDATPAEQEVIAVWEHVLGRKGIGPTDDLYELGGTSIDGMRILALLSRRSHAELPLSAVHGELKVRDLTALINQRGGSIDRATMKIARAHGSGIPLVCVLGDAANRHLPKVLPDRHPFYTFTHQGADGRAMVHTTIHSIAAHYLNELQQVLPSGPFVLIGYSQGGNIALEMARIAANQGRAVPLLVLIDTKGPKRIARPTLKRTLMTIRDHYDRWRCMRYLRRDLPIPVQLRLAYLTDMYARAYSAHSVGPWHNPVLLIRSAVGSHGSSGWEGTLSDLEEVVVPGDHGSVVHSGHVEAVANHIAQALLQLERGTDPPVASSRTTSPRPAP